MKKVVIVSGILLVAVSVGIFAYIRRSPAPAYRTAKVEKGAIVSMVTATGTLNAVITVQVGTQVSGTIDKLFVDYNSVVKKGQTIARIDPDIFNSQVQQSQGSYQNAVANLKKARADVVDAGRTMERNRQLLKDGVVSQQDFDTAETKYFEAQAGVKSAEGSVMQTLGSYRQAQTNLRYSTIKSPVDGIVVSRNVDVGQTVAASFQTPTLFTIAQDLTKMQIDTSVDEADIGKVKIGQPAVFTVDAYPGIQFKGIVAQVRNAPIVTQNVVTYDVVITVDNKDLKLKPGMTANVNIEVMRKDDVLKLPGAALRFRPKAAAEAAQPPTSTTQRRISRPVGQQVYVLKDGKPARIPVKTGATDDSFVELTSGNLRQGDEVIIEQVSAGKKKTDSSRPPMGPRF
ncbi:MAG TPA: efflux RND transporter periplasmic adaptor subunit [Geobacteraceae bacterium]|nr:efflux RND transporter periplasmic adaptor subunit [Geobacteraceae bacterium]